MFMRPTLLLWVERSHSMLVHRKINMNNILPTLTKVTIVLAFSLGITLVTKSALADEECRDPIANWQPREVLKKLLEDQGWIVQRIRIDDGCYKVHALDAQRRRVEAIYAPASLTLMEFELEDEEHERREHRDAQHQSR